MKTKICIPLVEKNIDNLISKIVEASKKNPSMIELWLGEIFPAPEDFSKNGEQFFEKIFAAKKEIGNIPFLLNVKDSKEKGNFCGTDEEKINILIEGIKRGSEYIDIDYDFNPELLEELKKEMRKIIPPCERGLGGGDYCKITPLNPPSQGEVKKTKLILSAHFFEGTPTFPSLKNRVQKMINSGADIVKIAAMPETERDIISILRLAENLQRKNIPFITMSMGQMGKLSRVMCPLLGSYLAFGSLDSQSASAPGQISVDELRSYIEEFKF